MKPEINTQLLEEVKTQIVKNHEHFNMARYFDGQGCGTTACIAGWAIAVANKCKTLSEADNIAYSNKMGARLTAGQLIGGDYQMLFHVINWPTKFKSAFNKAKTTLGKAKISARRIDHYIKTGK